MVARQMVIAAALFVASASYAQQPSVAPVEDGNRLLIEAVERIEAIGSLAARVRCRGELFDMPVRMDARYWQMNQAGRVLVHLDMELETGNSKSTIQQICDGRFSWKTMQSAASGDDRQVVRVDLRELQRQATQDKQEKVRLATGGLPALVQSLSKEFQFDRPHTQRLDDVQVYRLTGRRTLSDADAAPPEDPSMAYLPDEVVVMLGVDDFLPYRVEFRGGDRLLLLCELFEVHIGRFLDPELFRWKGDPHAVTDQTEELLGGKSRAPGGQ